MKVLEEWGALLREFLFPCGCAVCGAPLLDSGECVSGVCADCEAGLVDEGGERCPRCGRPLVSERGTCAECRDRDAPAFDDALALFRYGGIARKLLLSYKFGGCRIASGFIAARFLASLGPLARDTRAVVVPVPPRSGKMKRKGWDQVDRIARRIEGSGIAVSRCLRRLPSRSQKELGRRERATNLVGKIVCVAPPPKVAVLIDDVITTGATFDACARALKEGGSATVYALALCYD